MRETVGLLLVDACNSAGEAEVLVRSLVLDATAGSIS